MDNQIKKIIAHSAPIRIYPNRQYKSKDEIYNENCKYEISTINYAFGAKPTFNDESGEKSQNIVTPYECRIRNIT